MPLSRTFAYVAGEPTAYVGSMTQATSKRRGYGEDSVYWDASREPVYRSGRP
jgi:hypothetical protein